ncbi:NADPH-dependent F420 reductase [Burkholderia sp. Ac-20379]|uniref:NADPH-dependent F420 reductase n=1 Tax=Burkholderia sp. Ac-20379 TaxID=2703900 RepID=UPI001981F90E|nr:NAD(P)-binding domain-containing protein [Burkholderia sp. Ac-20379]MBN3727310.1 NAD(P)-binding domain-containing protein [Burkholderia sp. Ac-20379]
MNLSILGAGRVGTSLAQALVKLGHRVAVGHRNPQAGAARWLGPAVHHTTLAEAAGMSRLVINALPGHVALESLGALGDALKGSILLDLANATARLPDGMPGGLLYAGSSLGEQLQAALPGTQVVKTLNTMHFSVMTAPGSLATPPKAFLSGNDGDAKREVTRLLIELGWPTHDVLDLGAIESAQATEAMMLMVPHIVRAAGFKPFALTVAG